MYSLTSLTYQGSCNVHIMQVGLAYPGRHHLYYTDKIVWISKTKNIYATVYMHSWSSLSRTSMFQGQTLSGYARLTTCAYTTLPTVEVSCVQGVCAGLAYPAWIMHGSSFHYIALLTDQFHLSSSFDGTVCSVISYFSGFPLRTF